MKPERHPKNAPGPFYVVNELCLFCKVPEEVAPGLMAHTEKPYYHCYFRKQPANSEELAQAIRAVCLSCCGAVRYAGNDPDVIRQIELYNPEACDQATRE